MTEISAERLAELIAQSDADAASYERQGDEAALRWAKDCRDDAAALRELSATRLKLDRAREALEQIVVDLNAPEITDAQANEYANKTATEALAAIQQKQP